MARPARPWYRTSHMEWFLTIGGKQIPLGVIDPNDAAGAFAAAAALKPIGHHRPPIPSQPIPPDRTVTAVVTEFLEKRKTKISSGCWATYDIVLRGHFKPAFGTRPLPSLVAEEIEDWADRPSWSSSTRHDYLGVVQGLLKWGKHPLRIHRPPKESRGAEAVLSEEQFTKVLTVTTGDLRPLLLVLRETGARPQEIARLTAENVDWANTCTRTKIHKSRRHGGERVIYFNTSAMAILLAQRAKRSTGHLFRTQAGTAYSKDRIVHRMAAISKKVGFHVIAYGLGRHSFATAALVAGIPDAVVAELLGHRGTAMVTRNYGHVGGQSRVLKEAVERIGRPKAG